MCSTVLFIFNTRLIPVTSIENWTYQRFISAKIYKVNKLLFLYDEYIFDDMDFLLVSSMLASLKTLYLHLNTPKT